MPRRAGATQRGVPSNGPGGPAARVVVVTERTDARVAPAGRSCTFNTARRKGRPDEFAVPGMRQDGDRGVRGRAGSVVS